jgi:uncharacterized protein (DUF983 family)
MQQAEASVASFQEASNGAKLRRGLIRHCPACGSGNLFRHWFVMVERCPRCDLKFEREPGHWLGSLGMNTIISCGALLIALVVGVVVTYPDLPVGTLVAICVSVAVIVPIVYYPLSKIHWTAMHTCMNHLRPGEVKQPWGPPAEDGDTKAAS